MFDINQVEKDAKAELVKERGEAAKKKIKEKLRQIATARQVVANLEGEYELMLKDIGTTDA